MAIIKKALVLFLSILVVNVSYARTEKEIETFIKQLKKANKNVKKVEVKIEEDGYWYFSLKGEKDKYGAADSTGRIIIPVEYELISYHSALDEGTTTETRYSQFPSLIDGSYVHKTDYWHKKCDAVFLATKQDELHSLYSTDGELLRGQIKGTIERLPGYWKISRFGKEGLLSSNGETIYETEYNFIRIDGAKCYVDKYDNGTKYHGAMMLDGSGPTVPCKFYGVLFNKYYKDYVNNYTCGWEVRTNAVAYRYEEFNPDSVYITTPRDDGEVFFSQDKFDEVIRFYESNGIDAPWAKYFTAKALEAKCRRLSANASAAVAVFKGRSSIGDVEWGMMKDVLFTEPVDFELQREYLQTIKQLLEVYVADSTVEYHRSAISDLDMCEFILSKIDEEEKQYEEAKREFMLMLEQERLEQMRIAEERRLQRQREHAQIMSQILGTFLNALTNSIASSISDSDHTGSPASAPAQRHSGSPSSSDSGSSDSDSSSAETPAKRTRPCKACDGTGLWVDERISGDEKWCDRCGTTRKPHTHKECGACRGRGYQEM